jgi:hypothetical protein
MKVKLNHIAIIVSFSGLLMSCATTSQFSPGKGSKYQYTFELVYPVENSDLIYQDDSLIIQFKCDEAAIRFQLQNISTSDITIDWDKAAMSINGRYFAVRHSDNLYVDSIGSSSSFLLPTLGYVRDIAIPRDNIYYDGQRWIELDLLPTTDYNSVALRESIKKSVGQRITLLLPFTFGSVKKNYEFDFETSSIRQIPWKDYVPTKRVPAPPIPKQGVHGLDQVTTAIIAVGVLGFSAYVLTAKKNPPSE